MDGKQAEYTGFGSVFTDAGDSVSALDNSLVVSQKLKHDPTI